MTTVLSQTSPRPRAMLALGVSSFSFVCSPGVRPARAHAAAGVSMGTTADFKNGLTIEFEGQPWKIVEFLHVTARC